MEKPPEYNPTPDDKKTRKELEKVLKVMERQGAVGETQPSDYEDAIAKRGRDLERSERAESSEPDSPQRPRTR